MKRTQMFVRQVRALSGGVIMGAGCLLLSHCTDPGARRPTTDIDPTTQDDSGTGAMPPNDPKPVDSGTPPPAPPTNDAGRPPAVPDAAVPDAATGPNPNDAGAPTQGTCGGDTPHGCYVPQSGNHPMCPAQSPEQSASYPPMGEWKGCNGIKTTAPFGLDPTARCTYKGPAGQIASCLCDTDLHWLCACTAPNFPGTGTWPACNAP